MPRTIGPCRLRYADQIDLAGNTDMATINKSPVAENSLTMVGHCCGGRFPILQTLEEGIDFTPNAEAKADMEKLKTAANPPPAKADD